MKPYDIAQIFEQMELDLITSMKRNLTRHEAEEEREGFEWEQWQKRKLLALSRYRRENRKLLQDYGKVIDSETGELIMKSYFSGARGVDSLIDRLLRRAQNWLISGRVTKPITDVSDDSFFRINERRINALINAIQNDLRNGRDAMLRQADDVYRQTVLKSEIYLNTGAVSLNQAIDMATRDFLDKGFNCIEYKDGRRMNIASYAEMALRTSSQRAVFYGEGARRAEWGIHTVVISSHNNCSDLCLPWQGRVYIDDVYSGGKAGDGPYPLLSTAMSNGLFHQNCRHNKSTYFPGVSSLPGQVNEEKAEELYQAEQKQRYMERSIRQYKRREAGSIDPANEAAAAAKVSEWQARLREHMEANPQLRRDRSREQIKIPV
ncbi:phage minor capsid protein [Paenibacillus sp. M1]|uniref:Phage minor capsid protein n=1 Tax=Paenibacillus haidiansis TaxID=1574488 RepID=A0ABU7VZP0_9BACL